MCRHEKKIASFSLASVALIPRTIYYGGKKMLNVKTPCRLQPVSLCCQKRFFYYIPIMHILEDTLSMVKTLFMRLHLSRSNTKHYLIRKISILSKCGVHKRSVFGEKVREKRKRACLVYIELNQQQSTI